MAGGAVQQGVLRRMGLPYEAVPGFRENRILIDYLAGREPATSLLPPLLDGEEAIRRRAGEVRALEYPRAALAGRLLAYHEEHGAGEAALRGCRDIGAAGTLVCVTGQQPGLLAGPLYTVLKAITACLLARRVERMGLGRCVPVFWSASEDHDLAEANRHHILESATEERLSLDLEDRGASLTGYDIDGQAAALLERLRAALHPTEFTPGLLERVAGWSRGGFGGWFARMMMDLFAEEGLVLVEPRLLRDLAAPHVEREIRQPSATGEAIRDAGARLEAAGYARPLTGDEGPGLFLCHDGVRDRLHVRDGAIVRKSGAAVSEAELLTRLADEPAAFSSGVALRPVIQDALLPSVAMIAGPSEVAYLAQMGGVYAHHGVARPPLLPRVSCTLVEAKVERVLARLGVPGTGLFEVRAAHDAALSRAIATADDGFAAARADLESALRRLGDALPKGIRGAFPKVERRIRKEIERVTKKVEEEALRQQGLAAEQVARVETSVLPHGRLQERVWGIIGFMNRYGPDLVRRIGRSVALFAFEHQLLYLAEAPAGSPPPGESTD